MSEELKPCPFCGQQEAFVEQLYSDASVVICQGMVDEHSACLARGPVGVQQSDMEDQPGKDAAIAEWNRRAQPAEAEGMADHISAAIDNLVHDNYERSQAGSKYRQIDADLIRSALSAVTAERDRLREEVAEFDDLLDKLSGLLRQVAIELRGPEPELTRYGYADIPLRVKTVIDERDQLRAEVEPLREKAGKYATIERVMKMLECDEREGGVWTACTLLLIGSAHKMNSAKSVVEQEGVTVAGEQLGNWRVTVECVNAAMAEKEA